MRDLENKNIPPINGKGFAPSPAPAVPQPTPKNKDNNI